MAGAVTRWSGAALVALVLAACGQEPLLQQLVVSPSDSQVTRNLQGRVTATAIYADGSQRDVTAEATWSVEDETYASTAGQGLVQATTPGATYVVASFGGLKGSGRFEVLEATLVSIEVTTPSEPLVAGLTARAVAYGTFTDGSVRDISSSVTWSVSSAGAAVAGSGEVRGLVAGLVQVQASVGPIAAAASIQVRPAELVALTVEVSKAEPRQGDLVTFSATGVYTDGSQADLSGQVVWTSADDQVAKVYSFVKPGAVLAYLAGATTVTAFHPATGLSSVADFVVLP